MGQQKPRVRKVFLLGALLFLVFVLLCGLWLAWDAFVYEPDHPKVSKQTITSANVPPDIEKLKIVQLSDLHIVNPGVREKRMVQMVNDLQPDIILLTGDYIKDDGITPGKQPWRQCSANAIGIIRQLKPRIGTYAVFGNWDSPQMAAMFRKAGIHVLQDGYTTVKIGKSRLVIAGIDNSNGGLSVFHGYAPKSDYSILLSHYPEAAENTARMRRPFNLVLAGHYHGGQARIPYFRRAIHHEIKYQRGIYKLQGTTLYVNSGIGMHTLRVRFRCRPEITLLEIKETS